MGLPGKAIRAPWGVRWLLVHVVDADKFEFNRQRGAGTRQMLKELVEGGQVPGLLAYVGDEPVGWCAIAPRQAYPKLERSRVLKRVDNEPVWSVVCFFVAKPFRRKGVTTRLLEAAEYAQERGATIVEGYPVEPRQGSIHEAVPPRQRAHTQVCPHVMLPHEGWSKM